MLDALEVAKHNTVSSCFVIIQGLVYDVTDFIEDHPGGAAAILRYGGKDATAEYEPIHPTGTIEKTLSPDKCLGPVDPSSLPQNTKNETSSRRQNRDGTTKPVPATPQNSSPICISLVQNLQDIENEAKRVLTPKACIYFDSAANDLSSAKRNLVDWSRISFRPRVLRNVAQIRMSRKLLGFESALPFFIAPAARAKLGHPDGELCLVRGSAKMGIPYCVSSASSISHEELAQAAKECSPHGTLFFQLYASKMEKDTRASIKRAISLGYKALVVTVDTPVVGKREADDRYQAELLLEDGLPQAQQILNGDIHAVSISRGPMCATLNWKDLQWIKEEWADHGPLVLKGIQSAEDAKLAAQEGIRYIYLSNHGGRQIQSAPSSIYTLLEIRRFCPEILTSCEIYLDGGIRRGADILKALCLGATGVSLGRPFMYALSAYGIDGVIKTIQILKDEIDTTMRLVGVTRLEDLRTQMVNTKRLDKILPDDLEGFTYRSSML